MAKKVKGELPSGNVRYKLYIGKGADGKKKYMSFTARTKGEAKDLADAWKKSHKKQPENGPNLTFSEAAKAFIDNRSKTLSPSTHREYLRTLARLEDDEPMFTRSKVRVITSEKVQAVINSLATKTAEYRGRPLDHVISPKTVRNYYAFISAVLLSQGVELHGIKLPQIHKPELVIPDDDTVKKLLEAVKGTALEVPILLAAWGPMRRGEICALRLEDIDFGTNTVHVCRNMVLDSDGLWTIKAPKTASGDRYITYPPYVIDLIKDQGFITAAKPNTLSRNFQHCLDRHGIKSFRFHDLRHFAASFQIALGIPPTYVMERGGWSSPGTMQRYVHALDKQRRAMSDKANDAFSKML